MPALSFYYFAPFVKALGPRVLAVRLATTLVGLLAVVFVWLLGRELWGRDVGLLAAGFLAVSRWHVDFSRFGMAIVFPTLFIPATLYFFARSLKRASPRDAVLGGIVLGLGMQTYYAMLTVPILVVLAAALATASRSEVRILPTAGLTALLLLSTLLTYAPVYQYARGHEAEFNERMRTVSAVHAGSMGDLARILIQPSPKRAEAWGTLGRNAVAHAKMFHFAGDRNGRHNLPGAPMLDPVTGLFFAAGFVLALAGLYDWRNATLLLWFGAMIAAGILSLDFEAPQGARTCGLNSVIALLAALPLARLGAFLPAGAARSLLAFPVAAAGVLSWRTYFGPQLHDPKVFQEFSAVETRMAEVAKAEGFGADLYAPLRRMDAPVQMMILGRRLGATAFERWRDVPLEPTMRRVIFFLEVSQTDTVAELLRLYPHATSEPLAPTLQDGSKGEPIFYTVRVPPEDVSALSGLEVVYEGRNGARATARVAGSVLDWTHAPFAPPFTAHVRGACRPRVDREVRLDVRGDARARLGVDGEQAADAHGARALRLARGLHELSLEVDVPAGATETRLTWSAENGEQPIPAARLFQPIVEARGLLGSYHRGASCADPLAYDEIDPQVMFEFYGLGPSRPFAACWSGSLYAPGSGTYTLGTGSHAESTLSIDGRRIVDNHADTDAVDVEVPLEKGWHDVDVTYRGTGQWPHVELRWKPPGGALEYVPAALLSPPAPSGARRPRSASPPR
jgi:hypothetical protein